MRIKPVGRIRSFIWSKETIGNFELYTHARDPRRRQVESLSRLIRNGGHWESPIAVMEKVIDGGGARYIIIDGQHRYIAALDAIEDNKDFQITVTAFVHPYTSDPLAVNEIFKKYGGAAVKQTITDKIKMAWPINPNLHVLTRLEKTTCHIAKITTTGWSVQKVLFAYLYGTHGFQPQSDRVVNFVCTATKDDVRRIIDFLAMHNRVFGAPEHSSIYCTTTSLMAVSRIYFNNIERCDKDKMYSRLKKVSGDPAFIAYGRFQGITAIEGLTNALLLKINRGRKTHILTV